MILSSAFDNKRKKERYIAVNEIGLVFPIYESDSFLEINRYLSRE
jgi:hypothetical protein